MQKTAIVCVTNDLSTDQRVHKTCITLQKCGYWVIEVGRLLPDSVPLERSYFTLRKKLWFHKGFLFYAEYNVRLFLYLITKEVDLIFANDLDTLPAAFIVSKLRKKKLIFDAHELFPEVPELIHRPIIKGIWNKIEYLIFPRLKHSITVCKSISDYYNYKYNIQMSVVRNIPFYHISSDLKPAIFYPDKKIILYQGALNKGRGLEMVLDAMPLIENVMLVIIGDGDIRLQLEKRTKRLNIEDKVHFFGKISGDELYKYTPSASIGLCLLENKGLNYYYSLPNRIFDYLQAGVPVLATRFPEISNIVETYKTGILIEHYEPTYLAEVINDMLINPIDTSHFQYVAKELCWENEEKVLKEVINRTTVQ
jgi:glycosyltransferase involved in cell wall biosynthesis